ncbi:MAG: ATP-binding protein [Nanoarchaeota archaeon]|nr:ATP-binding protein [Nanoarchaeota archaeon]
MIDFKKIIVQWKEFIIPNTKKREVLVNPDSDFVTSISGPRRAGKTYLCFHMINELIKKGIDNNNILYINFEDEKLTGTKAEDLDQIMDAFLELMTINENQNIYLFLDEIQNVLNWDIWVRRIHDKKKNWKLVLTGSSSKLLSRELSTKLRGRVLNYEVYPLSLKELLEWNNCNYDFKTIEYSEKKSEIKKIYSDYLKDGGFPSIYFNPLEKAKILQSYYDSMLLKDIVERHNIQDVKKLRVLASFMFDSISSEMSYTKLANKLKSIGYNISKNTVIEYIDHFEESYVFFQNLKYEYSLQKQLGSIKKIYCIDNGLINSVSFKFSEDLGRLMENQMYIELKRRESEIFYHRDKYECDFIIHEKNKVTAAIQVTKELNDDNEKREYNGLIEAMEKHKLKSGTIITENQKETKKIENYNIKIIPMWQWLIGIE